MQQETVSQDFKKTYYFKDDLWRSALYLVIGSVIACPLGLWVGYLQGRLNTTSSSVIGSALWIALCVCALVAGTSLLLPRLRIDKNGIHRRLFFWYWDSWRWNDFGSGKIREGTYLDSYRDISRPLWRQGLALGNYPADAREMVRSTLLKRGVDFQVKIPESISVKVGSYRWQFNDNGILLQKSHTEATYDWGDIQSVSVTKLTHQHQNFRKLVVQLTDQKLQLQYAQGNLNWKGDPAEEILGFLQTHLPKEIITINALNGLPRSEAEAESQLQTTHREIRGLKKVLIFECVLLVAAALVGLFVFASLEVLVGILFAIIALFFAIKSAIQNAIQRLENQCAEISDWLSSKSNTATLGTT